MANKTSKNKNSKEKISKPATKSSQTDKDKIPEKVTIGVTSKTPDTIVTQYICIPRKKPVKPIIIIDPGHGDRIKGTFVNYDPGTLIEKDKIFEKDYALILGKALKKALDDDYVVYLTREADIDIDKKVKWRWRFANKKLGDIFIICHLDSTAKPGVFIVYEPKVDHEEESKKLANIALDKLSTVVTIDKDKIRSSKTTKHQTLGVLRDFLGTAAILFEFGGIRSTILGDIVSKQETIAKAVKEGIDEYVEKNW